jgi:hypothetical protein
MLTCTEQGHWPDVPHDGMSDFEVDALVDHAAVCPYHSELLDQDDEAFLQDLRAAVGLYAGGDVLGRNEDGVLVSMAGRASVSSKHADEDDYQNYQRWAAGRCSLEMLQVRCGERDEWTFNVTQGGGSWRLNIRPTDGVLRFWTLCHQHNDQVMLAAYPLGMPIPGRPEVSTLPLANGQSLSVLTRCSDGKDVEVLLHCTAPRSTGACYTAYNFDSLITRREFGEWPEHSKTPRLFEDLTRLAELRLAVRELESVRLSGELPNSKNIAELLGGLADASCQKAEPPSLSRPPDVRIAQFEPTEDVSDPSAQVMLLLKKWVDGQNGKRLNRPFRRVEEVTCQRPNVGTSWIVQGVWKERSGCPIQHTFRTRMHLSGGFGVAYAPGLYLKDASLIWGVGYEQVIVYWMERKNAASFSEVYRRLRKYYRCRADMDNDYGLPAPLNTCGRGQFLTRRVWPEVLRDIVDAECWDMVEVERRALFEMFVARFLKPGSRGISLSCDGGWAKLAFRQRMLAASVLERVCKSCVPQNLYCTGRAELPSAACDVIVNAGGGKWAASTGESDTLVVAPVAAPLLLAGACGGEYYGGIP